MNVTEILQQLPTLAFQERREIIERARALNKEEAEREACEISEACSDAMFTYLESIESKNEAHRAR
jgi:Mg2+ and Co2+ transporter CorA